MVEYLLICWEFWLMGIVYSSFYLEIYRLKKEYEANMAKDARSCSLLARISKALKNYDTKTWKSLEKYYISSAKYLASTEEKLIFFLLLSIYKGKLKHFSFKIIDALIYSLIETKVNPYNYEVYVQLFLDEKVYDLLLLISLFTIFHPISNILSMIIFRAAFDEISQGNYEFVKKMLSTITSSAYSPIFDGKYDFLSIHKKIKEIMDGLNQKMPMFSEQHFKTLDLLLSFDDFSNEEIEEFQKRVIAIEEEFLHNKKRLVQAILLQVQLFSNMRHVGLKLLRFKEN